MYSTYLVDLFLQRETSSCFARQLAWSAASHDLPNLIVFDIMRYTCIYGSEGRSLGAHLRRGRDAH